jgi:hypothetical protein
LGWGEKEVHESRRQAKTMMKMLQHLRRLQFTKSSLTRAPGRHIDDIEQFTYKIKIRKEAKRDRRTVGEDGVEKGKTSKKKTELLSLADNGREDKSAIMKEKSRAWHRTIMEY